MSNHKSIVMTYQWFYNNVLMTERELAEFTLKHAHEFYKEAKKLTVFENGVHYAANSESVYREDAFRTASSYYNCNYDVFYLAWLNEKPVKLRR